MTRYPGETDYESYKPLIPDNCPILHQRLSTIILIISALIAFSWILVNTWKYTVDDSFITFRYAENVTRGYGLTFNQGAPHSEGYTSLLWTIIMIIPHAIGVNAIIFSKLVGVLLILCTAVLIFLSLSIITKKEPLQERAFASIYGSLLFLSFPYCGVHSVSGMETALAAFLYALTATLFLGAQNKNKIARFLPFSCLLLGLTRPEANLFCIILLILAVVTCQASNRKKLILFSLVFYVLPGLMYFAWRFHYYELLWPLPFYIKSGELSLSGIGPAYSFVKNLAIGFTFPLAVFFMFAPRRLSIVILPLFSIFAYLLTIQHIMGYGDRYFFPLVPVLAILASVGVMKLNAIQFQYFGIRIKSAINLILGLAILFGLIQGKISAKGFSLYAQGLNNAHIRIGRTLANIHWKSTPLIAIGDAGAVPYYSKLKVIDTYGLNDPFIATHFHDDRSAYILSKKPSIIVLISKDKYLFKSPLQHENSLYELCLINGYVRGTSFEFNKEYFLWIMWKPDSINTKYIKVLSQASRRID